VLRFGAQGSGRGMLDDPRAVAVNHSGNIYVADYSDRRIQTLNPYGNFLRLTKVG